MSLLGESVSIGFSTSIEALEIKITKNMKLLVLSIVIAYGFKESRSCCQMTQLYEIWERQADRYYEMRRFVDDNDEKIKSVEEELLETLKNENRKLRHDIKHANQRVETVEAELETLRLTVEAAMKTVNRDRDTINESIGSIEQQLGKLTDQNDSKQRFEELLEEANEIRKNTPPLIAFRATGTSTTTTANPGNFL